MASTDLSAGKGLKNFEIAVASVIGILLAYLFVMALRFQINPFDSFELFSNARRMGGVDQYPHYWKRAPFLPLMIAPLFTLEKFVIGDGFAPPAARLLAVLFFAGLLFTAWRFFLKFLTRGEAAFAVLLMAANRLLIHHAPFTKEDVPGALLVASALFFYQRSRERTGGRDVWLAGAFAAGAITTRYNMIPEMLGLFALCEIHGGFWRDPPGRTLTRAAALAVVPLVFLLALHSLLYLNFEGVPLWQGPSKFIKDILTQLRLTSQRGDSSWENYVFLWLSATPPVCLAALAGAVHAIRNKIREAAFFGIWFGFFFLFQTYFLGDKEGRYLFPLMIPFYYFAVLGLREIYGYLEKVSGPRSWLAPALAGLVLAWPLRDAAAECLRFQDPFYTTDFERKMSLHAKDMAGPFGKVFWIGRKYPLYPKAHVFHPDDEFCYIYHFYNHVVRFYIHERVFTLENAEIAAPDSGVSGFFVPNIGEAAANGDVLILNVEPDDYQTRNLPKVLKPILMERVRTISFFPDTAQSGAGVFRSPPLPTASIQVTAAAGGAKISGSGVPDQLAELYIGVEGSPKLESVRLIRPTAGSFEAECGRPAGQINRIVLLGYEKPEMFFHPSMMPPQTGEGSR